LALARRLHAEEEVEAGARAWAPAGARAGAGSNDPSSSSLSPPLRSPPGVCPGCMRSTAFALGRTVSTLGAVWHAVCFTCTACHEAISELRFAVKGGRAYHRHCYRDCFHPRCGVCTQVHCRP
jgi:hypothetical protein